VAVEVPHFTIPFQWVPSGTGGVTAQTAEQESTDEIGSCCEAIIRTVQGQRTTLPAFGRPELEFITTPDAIRAVLAQALQAFEPRVSALIVDYIDPDDDLVQVIRTLISPADDVEAP
jgi:phage baseplate assembly protein W